MKRIKNRKAGNTIKKREKRKPGLLREILNEFLDSIVISLLIRIVLWIPRVIFSFFKNLF
ncbi:hypothetical protein A361_13475 [Cytobacillus oceanisediminis 2691]|uniref:Uncharacterized protein n=1 Tax=Cytobacillus oceanisediminis 2691 TaxID=1196031 RepID=A0A160MBB7_9BACI|nr:hypothetical protein A361_13475 [Cytobacillus oceanisediminis 2691]